jgi:hypothetical protein
MRIGAEVAEIAGRTGLGIRAGLAISAAVDRLWLAPV